MAAEVERLKIDHELGFVIFHRAGAFLSSKHDGAAKLAYINARFVEST